MLAALKRRKKQTVKLTVLQKIQANANRRKNERESSNSTSLRTQRMKKDSKLLTTYRRTALHKQQQHRKKQLAQKELEAKDFKRWVKHRNPNLNRTIDQKNQRNQWQQHEEYFFRVGFCRQLKQTQTFLLAGNELLCLLCMHGAVVVGY